MMHLIRSVFGEKIRPLFLTLCLILILAFGLLSPSARVISAAPPSPQGSPSVVGQWAAPIFLGFIPIHVSVLPNGKVLMWGRDLTFNQFGNEVDVNDFSQSYIFDPDTNSFTSFPFNSTTNLFCSGHCFLPDGRLLVAGGHDGDDGRGEATSNIFDYNTNSYSLGPFMNQGRWYPTTCALGNGETLVLSGTNAFGQLNPLPQVLQTNQTWRPLNSASDPSQPLYPRLLLAPNSRVFTAGQRSLSRYLSTSGAGAWQDVDGTDTDEREYGSAVMYDDGKVLIMGGGAPTNTAQKINLNVDTPLWTPVSGNGSIAPMAIPRRQLNATLLADGKVLVTGGSSAAGFSNPAGAVFAAEMWNPANATWSTMASASRPRLYHSTAVLLPDGRVLTGGGGGLHPPDHSQDEPSIEIYSPPYLFNGPRPTITSAPTVANHGEQVFVGTPDVASISNVTMVKLSSVTHAFNQNQRVNTLSFRKVSGGVNVTIPGSGHLCPPGHYMLFLINSSGVPSIASIIRVTIPTGTSNAINDQRYFTAQHYYDFLNREPDAPGLAHWTNQITQCGNNATCIDGKRVDVSRAFWYASEFLQMHPGLRNPPGVTPDFNNREFVRLCYVVYLRRDPDQAGWDFWTNELNNDTANDPHAYNHLIRAFLVCSDYMNRFYKP